MLWYDVTTWRTCFCNNAFQGPKILKIYSFEFVKWTNIWAFVSSNLDTLIIEDVLNIYGSKIREKD